MSGCFGHDHNCTPIPFVSTRVKLFHQKGCGQPDNIKYDQQFNIIERLEGKGPALNIIHCHKRGIQEEPIQDEQFEGEMGLFVIHCCLRFLENTPFVSDIEPWSCLFTAEAQRPLS